MRSFLPKNLAVLIIASALAAPAPAAPVGNLAGQPAMQCLNKDFTLQLLGSGGPISDDQRASSGALIWWKGKAPIMIDAGGGTYLRFGQSGAKLENLDFIGISHFHTDHSADLAAILKGSYFFDSRHKTLAIAGPAGSQYFPSLTGYLNALFNPKTGAYAYLSGLNSGTDGLLALTPVNVDYHGKKPVQVFQKDDLTVTALGIPHGNVPALAYRIDSPRGSIVISADQNGSNDAFIDFARGADILVMPAAIVESDTNSSTLHAKPSVVGKIAAQINPKMLVLDHWMGRGLVHKQQTLDLIAKDYHGPIYAARDLSCFPVVSK